MINFRCKGLVKTRFPLENAFLDLYGKPIYGGMFGYGEWLLVAIPYPATLPELRYAVVHGKSGFHASELYETKSKALERARAVLRLFPASDIATMIQDQAEAAESLDLRIAERKAQEAPPEPAQRRAARGGYVYLIRCDDRYKIGKAVNVEVRLRSMMLPSKPETVATRYFDKPHKVETELHRQFKHCRENGEWFRLTPAEVDAAKACLLEPEEAHTKLARVA